LRRRIVPLEQPPLERQIKTQVERLIEEDGQRHAPEEIERMAQDVTAEHAAAPVQQYVPNLIYNEIKTKLVEDGQETEETLEADRQTSS